MNPLLYSSNEMFSSTELIRKSKMIFDKLLSSEIEKAIILRDGKPGFMLLDFEKYEEIMKEYLALKENVISNVDEKVEQIEAPLEKVTEPIKEDTVVEEKVEEVIKVKPEPKKDESSEEQFEHIEEDISEDDLKKALEDIEKLGLEDESNDKSLDEEFDFADDFQDVVKEKKEQPLKEFWD